jgi:hypothetical protein
MNIVPSVLPHVSSGYVRDFRAVAWVFCFVVFVLLIFQSYLIGGVGGGGELEDTVGRPLDLNTTRSGLPTVLIIAVLLETLMAILHSLNHS